MCVLTFLFSGIAEFDSRDPPLDKFLAVGFGTTELDVIADIITRKTIGLIGTFNRVAPIAS